jgi:type IX secretion system PorP/SprF family membrane protein
MNNLYTAIVLIILCLSTSVSIAQQDPHYTQYMYNQAVINPAYAGSKENLSLTLLYRNQWTGLEGAPDTFTFSGHTPVGEKVGMGLSVIADKIGPVKENNVYADFSYKLTLGDKHTLALGLKGGITLHDIALADVTVIDPNDPLFSQNVNSATPNFGAGLFLYSDRYYFGLSVPNFLNSVHLDENNLNFGSETQHYFVTGGYVFQLSENTKLKPSFMVKSAFDAPMSFDINANFLFFDRFEIGASYRLEDSFSGMVNFAFTDNIKLGYAYDRVMSDLNVVTNSSHEVFLQFDLNFPRKVSRSPRFF